jgi:hypothetical protein
MRIQNSKCLVLNADYTPLSIISWKRALVWHIKYQDNLNLGIDIIDFYKDDHIIGTQNKKYPIPAVVLTKRYFHIKSCDVKFSRKNIFIRDNYTCQYCEKQFDSKNLTYDHLIPKSKWTKNTSPTTWTNIVTSCAKCNRKKGDKTLEQAKMSIRCLPIKPNKNKKFLQIYEYLDTIKNNIPQEWAVYL